MWPVAAGTSAVGASCPEMSGVHGAIRLWLESLSLGTFPRALSPSRANLKCAEGPGREV